MTDFQTLLMWAMKDNGQDVTWAQANAYCQNLRIENHSDWRLPRPQELMTIQGSGAPRGKIQSTGISWTAVKGDQPGSAIAYSFATGKDFSVATQTSQFYRALCVRGGK